MTVLKNYIKLARPHHWIKNVLVLVPAFFSGNITHLNVFCDSIIAFFIFSLASSIVYIMNDLRDVKDDRLHIKKKKRPLASGEVSPVEAIMLLLFLLGIMGALYSWFNPTASFGLIIVLYLVINIGYSMGLKHVPILEIFLIASGYMLRLVCGGLAVQEPLSQWIIISTGLIALLLAAGKRRGDMAQGSDKMKRRKSLEGYTLAYLDQMISLLGAATVVTYLLFCISDYATIRFGDHMFWSSILVLFGIMRYIQIITVHKGGDQPANLFYTDVPLLATVLCFTAFFAVDLYVLR